MSDQPVNMLHNESNQPRFRNKSRFPSKVTHGFANNRPKKKPPSQPTKQPINVCRNCVGHFPHKEGMSWCPAQGIECNHCHMLHYYAKFCLSRIPHGMKAKVNAKLEELRNEGIIEKVQGATPWLSPLIAIPKKNRHFRFCFGNANAKHRPYRAKGTNPYSK